MLMTEDDIGKLGTLGGEKEYFFSIVTSIVT